MEKGYARANNSAADVGHLHAANLYWSPLPWLTLGEIPRAQFKHRQPGICKGTSATMLVIVQPRRPTVRATKGYMLNAVCIAGSTCATV